MGSENHERNDIVVHGENLNTASGALEAAGRKSVIRRCSAQSSVETVSFEFRFVDLAGESRSVGDSDLSVVVVERIR